MEENYIQNSRTRHENYDFNLILFEIKKEKEKIMYLQKIWKNKYNLW